jgi:N-methylhydantoinase B/oxoprolinase/acetone carboxylase alpha subunit
MEPLKIVLPDDSLLNPKYPAAVVAGNVETSQCITDALLAAVDACAASQGTMNNFTFGNARHQYYETLCGGAGAGPGFDGASAVHTHMTNSRLTDPEVLEQRFPVRVRRFAIRLGSGGAGRWRGGDGVVRRSSSSSRCRPPSYRTAGACRPSAYTAANRALAAATMRFAPAGAWRTCGDGRRQARSRRAFRDRNAGAAHTGA